MWMLVASRWNKFASCANAAVIADAATVPQEGGAQERHVVPRTVSRPPPFRPLGRMTTCWSPRGLERTCFVSKWGMGSAKNGGKTLVEPIVL